MLNVEKINQNNYKLDSGEKFKWEMLDMQQNWVKVSPIGTKLRSEIGILFIWGDAEKETTNL